MKKSKETSNGLTVRQVRSVAGRNDRVKDTLAALGLGRIGDESQVPSNDAIHGMLKKVNHLVSIVGEKS